MTETKFLFQAPASISQYISHRTREILGSGKVLVYSNLPQEVLLLLPRSCLNGLHQIIPLYCSEPFVGATGANGRFLRYELVGRQELRSAAAAQWL